MFYLYDERNKQLADISKIADQDQKLSALKLFICEERNCLSQLNKTRSQALEAAQRMIDTLNSVNDVEPLSLSSPQNSKF